MGQHSTVELLLNNSTDRVMWGKMWLSVAVWVIMCLSVWWYALMRPVCASRLTLTLSLLLLCLIVYTTVW